LEPEINSAQDVLDRGLQLFTYPGNEVGQRNMQSSPVPTYQKLGETLIVSKSYKVEEQIMKEGLFGAGTHVYLSTDVIDYEDFGEFYWSKEIVSGYYVFGSWVVNKKWPQAGALNKHLIAYSQVSHHVLSFLFHLKIFFRWERYLDMWANIIATT
jgi:hypothetical protein